MNKLVRDFIPQIIEDKGQGAIVYVADEEEYRQRLIDKLFEEVKEFDEAKSMEELADILEVIDAIYDAYRFSKEEVEKVKKAKKEERGGFTRRYILNEVLEKNPL